MDEEIYNSSDQLTPKEIVKELDYYIIGQQNAKKAVAIALRNRFRRQQLPKEIADDIIPKNILMIGPTGVGKTEIARRLAKLTGSPFIKIEASKFTEVGYVGRDVESLVRDLVRISVDLVKVEKMEINHPRNGNCFCNIQPEQPLHCCGLQQVRTLQGECSTGLAFRTSRSASPHRTVII